MKKAMKAAAMNDEALAKISGGNDGDSLYEIEHRCQLHYMGEEVEVYCSFFHWHTKHGRIISIEQLWEPDELEGLYATVYLVYFPDSHHTEWVKSNEIERK